jgi:hypothetical protein
MTRRPAARGGVLLDLFIIACLLAGGAAAWLYWKRGGRVPSLPALLAPTATLAPKSEPRAEPDVDISDRSVWLQARVRELLAKYGVGEKHVVKTYNAERLEGGIQWL